MITPPVSVDEADRLAVLRRLEILDTAPEAPFDRLTRLVQDLFDSPIALVSLVDAERQWFKARLGLDACETDRSTSFCGHAIQQTRPMWIEDTLEDERFHDNPLVVGEPWARFYAGAPIAVEGAKIGALCVIDTRPRAFDRVASARLAALAAIAADVCEMRLSLAAARRSGDVG